MKSFFGICVLSALAAVGTTQPTHKLPHHGVGQTQHHITSQSEPHVRQANHYNNQPEHGYDSWSIAEAQAHSQATWKSPEQPSYQPGEMLSKPQSQHGYDSWSTVEAEAHSQATWKSPEQPSYQPGEMFSKPQSQHGYDIWSTVEQPSYQPGEILSKPHHINQPYPHIIHSQPQPIDPQFELHQYQHPQYPPAGSHHTQDTGSPYPTHGWNTQNPVVYQHQLPETPAPEHHINSEDPYQSSAVASVPSFSNSVPVSNQEPAPPQLYKVVPIPKVDAGADYNMPVANHETRHPKVIYTSNDEGLSDIVQEILAKYRHIPIEIKPKPDNNVPSKEQKSESHGPVHRPHKHKKHKAPTIPVVTKHSAKAKAVAVEETGTDKRYTIITGGKHSKAAKVPLKPKHKHLHKKVLKPLLDPELLAKELDFLSKEFWPNKTHETDIPCDDNPIITDDPTNSEVAVFDDGSNLPDKNKPKDKPKDKYNHISSHTTPEGISEKTTTPSTYIEPNDKKDADDDTDCNLASLGTKPCDGDNPPEKKDKRKIHKPKQNIIGKQNINSKPVDPKIENNDFKEEEVVQKIKVKKELTKKVETKNVEKIDHSETKKNEGKQNPKTDQTPDPGNDDNVPEEENERKKDVLKPKTHGNQNTDPGQNKPKINETTEPCDGDKAPEEKNERKKHVPKFKTDDKQNNDPDQNKPKNKPTKHHHNKHAPSNTPTNIVAEKDTAKTTIPSTNVKPVDQKDADTGKKNDSADFDKTTKPCDTVNTPEKEDKTKKHLPKPKADDTKNTASKPVDNKKNIDTITDINLGQKNDVKKVEINKVETKKKVIVHQSKETEKQLETYNEKQKPIEQDYNAPVSDEIDSTSTEDFVNQGPYEKIPASEYKDKKEQSIPNTKKDNNKPQPENTKKGNNDTLDKQNNDLDKNQPKNNPIPHNDNKHTPSHTATNILPKKNTAKTPIPSTNDNPVDQKDADRDKKFDSPESYKTTEPCDTVNTPEKEDVTKKHLPKPKADDTKNTASKPVDNKKNIDTITDNKIEQKEDVKQVETKIEETVNHSEKTKKQPEIYDEKQKPVEQETYAPDCDECDSTESSVNQGPYDKVPAPGHKKEIESLPNKKDDHKPVSPDSYKRNRDNIIIAKQDVKKVKKTKQDQTQEKKIIDKKEETVKVEKKIKESTKNVISSKVVDKSKPETSNENSDLDDCNSADSESDPKLDKTKANKDNHDPVVAETMEKTKTDQPLSTVGFLITLISRALKGDSVKQMFEEPKVKTFVEGIIPLFYEKP